MGIDEYSILKKKPKKNAFAATALLISIAIALLVMVGAVLVLSKVNDKDRVTPNDNGSETSKNESTTCEGLVKEIVFDDNLRNIKEAAINYFTNERLPQEIGDTVKVTLREMQDKKLVRKVYDASANACDPGKSYVEVTKEKDEYIMKVFLSCSDIEDYIIVHLGCYDYCDKDVCEKEVEPEKVFEYEYKKTTSCVMSPWSNWGNWQTTREKTSNLKKEDIKTETSSKDVTVTIDATANTSYNCDNYPGYTRVGTKCVKETTVTDTKDATPSKYSYNCDKYPGYSLVGSKCIKETTDKDIKDATPTCPEGYDRSGSKCIKKTTSTVTIDATPKCPEGYNQSGSKCIKKTTSTIKVDAKAVYSTRSKTEYYTCYKQECTTKTVFKCPQGSTCGNYPETSCESVKKTCSRKVDEKYISDYTCPDSTYTKTTDKDGKYICTKKVTKTDEKDLTYVCPSDYDQNGKQCVKKVTKTDEKDLTYVCPSDYDKNGKQCIKLIPHTDTKEATKVPGGYVCPEGYTQKDKTCTKVTVTKDEKNASKKVSYSCPVGYNKNDKTCTKKGSETIKKTYYRYATRTCNGGSTSIKWSTSNNDSILKGEGYKLTGNKREIKDIVK